MLDRRVIAVVAAVALAVAAHPAISAAREASFRPGRDGLPGHPSPARGASLGPETRKRAPATPGPSAPTPLPTASGTPPTWQPIPGPARSFASTIYDPLRNRLILFGGLQQGYDTNQLWCLSLAGAPKWTQLLPSGPLPAPRDAHTAIYDPVRDRMIVYGGSDYRGSVADVWILSLSTLVWEELQVQKSPSARAGHSAIYDPTRDQMVIFGGRGQGTLNDVWALHLGGTPEWDSVTTTNTSPHLEYHSAVYDRLRDRMIVFGGATDPNPQHVTGVTYALSLSSAEWTTLSGSKETPQPRKWHTAVYDPDTDGMFLFGGYNPNNHSWVDGFDPALWRLALSTCVWSQVTGSGSPSPRDASNIVIDEAGRRLLVLCGSYHVDLSDVSTFSISMNQWQKVIPMPLTPNGVAGATMTYDPPRDRMILFGGYWDYFSNDLYAFAGDDTWSMLSPGGNVPPPRAGHAAVYDAVGGRMIVYGGLEEVNYTRVFGHDVWALSLQGALAWSQVMPSGGDPGGRLSGSAVFDSMRDRMIVFGGWTGSVLLNDVWSLDLSGVPTWHQLTPAGTPPAPRDGHSAIYDPIGDRMIVFGGESYGGPLGDVWSLSLAGEGTWQVLAVGQAGPASRHSHSAVYDGNGRRMLVYGGTPWEGSTYNDIWALSLDGPATWSEVVPFYPSLLARWDHVAAFDPVRNRMIVFGGTQDYFYDTWALMLGDLPTGVVASLVAMNAEPGRVHLEWQVTGGLGERLSLERSEDGLGWREVAQLGPDLAGRLGYDDVEVVGGRRYGYRLAAPGSGPISAAIWADVPKRASLRLAGFRPNPVNRYGRLAFSLMDGSPARLEAFDVGGRRVMAEEVGRLGAGHHEIPLRGLEAGVYLIRLSQGLRTLTARGVVVQ